VTEWAATRTPATVRRVSRPRLPRDGEVLIGGPDDVRDLGVGGVDLVAILDADGWTRRPGLSGRERALATWFEAAAWARPTGRVLIHASDAGDPMIQALVRGNAARFLDREREERARSGFPVGAAVFRVLGDDRLPTALEELPSLTSLISTLGGRTVCLLALAPGDVPAFGIAMRRLAVGGVVERVEAEPHL
jgi:primosomal protein N'